MNTAPVITINTGVAEAMLARTKKKVRPGILMSVVLEKAKRVVHDNFQKLNVLGALRHKIFGGAVTPKSVKFLTIPISEQAKFQSARGSNAAHGEIPGLFLARGKNGRGLFLAAESNGNLVVHYLLKKSITHKPHPEVMPSTAEFAHAVQSACDEFAGGVTR